MRTLWYGELFLLLSFLPLSWPLVSSSSQPIAFPSYPPFADSFSFQVHISDMAYLTANSPGVWDVGKLSTGCFFSFSNFFFFLKFFVGNELFFFHPLFDFWVCFKIFFFFFNMTITISKNLFSTVFCWHLLIIIWVILFILTLLFFLARLQICSNDWHTIYLECTFNDFFHAS